MSEESRSGKRTSVGKEKKKIDGSEKLIPPKEDVQRKVWVKPGEYKESGGFAQKKRKNP